MTEEQKTEMLLKHSREISALEEKVASAHKRIDENSRITEGIHKLAANMESLTMQLKLLTENMEEGLERLERGQKSQGERIGALEKEPATKWKALVAQIVSLGVAAIFGVIVAKLIN